MLPLSRSLGRCAKRVIVSTIQHRTASVLLSNVKLAPVSTLLVRQLSDLVISQTAVDQMNRIGMW